MTVNEAIQQFPTAAEAQSIAGQVTRVGNWTPTKVLLRHFEGGADIVQPNSDGTLLLVTPPEATDPKQIQRKPFVLMVQQQ